jgi:hypothetical protein
LLQELVGEFAFRSGNPWGEAVKKSLSLSGYRRQDFRLQAIDEDAEMVLDSLDFGASLVLLLDDGPNGLSIGR